MKNKLISLLMTIMMLMALTACQAKSNATPTETASEAKSDAAPTETAAGEKSDAASTETASGEQSDAIPTETASGEPSGTSSGESAEAKNARLVEYQFALRQIAFEHVYPDGTDTGFDSAYGAIEDNRFALYDVDGDGVDELIVRFLTAPMAGNTETIYTYQKADGTLKPIFMGSPTLTYYANGVIKEDWSHGTWLAGEGYWPYTLYHYNVAEESFEQIAQVDMWSKAVSTVNEQGDPYPDDIDTEGAGTVFILTHQGMVDTISRTDYEQWLSDTMGSTVELDIPYQALSEENIDALNRAGTEADMTLTGPWHLDSEKNDLTAFQDTFPAYAEFGASMEIKSDGQISWYIGAEGGSGNYTQDGDTLTADIVTDVDQQQITVPFRIISDGKTVQLEMEYNETTVYWIYGDSGETFN